MLAGLQNSPASMRIIAEAKKPETYKFFKLRTCPYGYIQHWVLTCRMRASDSRTIPVRTFPRALDTAMSMGGNVSPFGTPFSRCGDDLGGRKGQS